MLAFHLQNQAVAYDCVTPRGSLLVTVCAAAAGRLEPLTAAILV